METRLIVAYGLIAILFVVALAALAHWSNRRKAKRSMMMGKRKRP